MNIRTISFDILGDNRGSLIALEGNKNIPFDIKRVYYIFGTKENIRRGFHAHKTLKQVAVCVKGSCKFLLDDGKDKCDIELNAPYVGLCFEGLLWREMYDFSPDCILMIFADDIFREEDYIRDYAQFLEEVKNGTS
jgi:hypothetical protein